MTGIVGKCHKKLLRHDFGLCVGSNLPACQCVACELALEDNTCGDRKSRHGLPGLVCFDQSRECRSFKNVDFLDVTDDWRGVCCHDSCGWGVGLVMHGGSLNVALLCINSESPFGALAANVFQPQQTFCTCMPAHTDDRRREQGV